MITVTGEGGWSGLGVRGQRGLEVVDDSADGLDVGVLGLPLVMAAVVSTLNNVHAATEVWLLVHHPAGGGARREERRGLSEEHAFINLSHFC